MVQKSPGAEVGRSCLAIVDQGMIGSLAGLPVVGRSHLAEEDSLPVVGRSRLEGSRRRNCRRGRTYLVMSESFLRCEMRFEGLVIVG